MDNVRYYYWGGEDKRDEKWGSLIDERCPNCSKVRRLINYHLKWQLINGKDNNVANKPQRYDMVYTGSDNISPGHFDDKTMETMILIRRYGDTKNDTAAPLVFEQYRAFAQYLDRFKK